MNNAVVLLSGGQDSATCLAWALDKFKEIHTISFDYGQRHYLELKCSKTLSSLARCEHFEIKITSLSYLSDSALLNNSIDINGKHSNNENLPASFVPGRNMLFLNLAAIRAYQLNINNLITGVCQTDYSGYPDCRNMFIKSAQKTLSLCMDINFKIHTPLMWKTKADTVLMMQKLNKLDWYKHTLTCYEGKNPPCLKCPSCLLRQKGFDEAGIIDPLLED